MGVHVTPLQQNAQSCFSASGSLPVATSSQSLVAQCISIWRWQTLMYVCTHRPRCGPVSARDALDKGEDRRHCSARRNALHTARKGPKALDHRAHWPADPAMCSSIAQACGTHHDPGTPLFSSESVLTRCVRQPRHPLCASLPSDQVSPCDTWLTRCNVAPPLRGSPLRVRLIEAVPLQEDTHAGTHIALSQEAHVAHLLPSHACWQTEQQEGPAQGGVPRAPGVVQRTRPRKPDREPLGP